MTLPFRNPFDPPESVDRQITPEIQSLLSQDAILVRTLFEDLQQEWSDLTKYRTYYEGDQGLVYGSAKFQEMFTDFEGFEDNWCGVVIDAVSEKIKLIGLRVDDDKSEEDEENPITKRIWDIFRDNDIDEQEGDLTEGVLVEGRAAVIVWPDEKKGGASIDWNPANLVKVRYSENDYKEIDFAIKRWVTPSGRILINVYDRSQVRKYIEGRDTVLPDPTQTGITATIPTRSPNFSLTPRFVTDEPWPLGHDFGEVPVVEFLNKRGSELSDVIPLQDAINYLLIATFVAGEFSALKQKVLFTHLKQPEGGWSNIPGRVWHVPPAVDQDGRMVHGSMDEFGQSDLGEFRQIIEMVLQHLALTSKTPVRMFFKSDRGGRGDAPSGESQLIEDEPLLDKCEDRMTRLGNKWFRVARLVAKAVDIDSDLRGEMIWQDPRSKYSMALLGEAVKLANPKDGLGLPIQWVVKRLGLTPEDLAELQKLIQAQIKEQEAALEKEEEAATAAASSSSGESSNNDGE